MSFLLDLSTIFYYTIWLYDYDSVVVWQFVTVTYDIMLNPNSKFQNRK